MATKTTFTGGGEHIFPIENWDLPMKSVYLEFLDGNGVQIPGLATGWFLQKGENTFVVTCWHVVTGYDYPKVEVTDVPKRKFMRVTSKSATVENPGSTSIDGRFTLDVPLYENDRPRWLQEEMSSKDYPDLETRGIYVPLYADLVAVPIDIPPTHVRHLCVHERHIDSRREEPNIGDDVYIVGYPYGYSALGMNSPEPICVKRAMASTIIDESHLKCLLDGMGAGGMSGSPVYTRSINTDQRPEYMVVGVYTGAIFPERQRRVDKQDMYSSLGAMTHIQGLDFIRFP